MKSVAAKPEQKVKIALGSKELSFSARDLHLMFGSVDPDFVESLIAQAATIVATGAEGDTDAAAFALAIVRGIEPRDQLEAMLAVQMAAVHRAIVAASARMAQSKVTVHHENALRSLVSLTRTYMLQLEALKRYRGGTQQKVVVEHVTVNEGGQAVVGSVGSSAK